MLHWLSIIVSGFVVGLIARAILPGTQHLGFLMTVVLGCVGSLVGGAIAHLISPRREGANFHPAGFLMSIVGALICLFAYTKLGL